MKIKQYWELQEYNKIVCYVRSSKYSTVNDTLQTMKNTNWSTNASGRERWQKIWRSAKISNPRAELFQFSIAV